MFRRSTVVASGNGPGDEARTIVGSRYMQCFIQNWDFEGRISVGLGGGGCYKATLQKLIQY